MIIRDAIQIFQISQKNIHRKRTKDSYRYFLEHLENHFGILLICLIVWFVVWGKMNGKF